MPRIAVFSDLDGTLLDHSTYSWEPARPALERLKADGIMLVLASSKTAAELVPLRSEMGFDHCPCIVENGAGIVAAGEDAGSEAIVHDALMNAVSQMPETLRQKFESFSDWGAEGIAEHTGLPRDAAEAAGKRQFSEPGIWNGTDAELEDFIANLAEQEVHARHGGRFLTLSFGANKADRMTEIATSADAEFTLALGDAPNDIEMIEAATHGVIIKNGHGNPMPTLQGEADKRIIRTAKEGPSGWNDAVNHFLDHFENGQNWHKGVELG